MSICYVLFFKQKTAYDMRISDWSSDVRSSDLRADILEGEIAEPQIVGPAEEAEHFLARRVGRIEGLGPRPGDRRRHGIARAIDAADRHRRARRPARDDRQCSGRRGIVSLVGEKQHLSARDRKSTRLNSSH